MAELLGSRDFELRTRRIRLSVKPEDVRGRNSSPWIPEKAQAGDLPAAMELIRASFDPVSGCILEEDELAEDIKTGRLMVVREDAELIGIHNLRRKGSVSENLHIAVSPEFQRQGLGEAMMLDALKAEGIKTHRLWVNKDNRGALALYEKLGFGADGRSSDVLVHI